MLFSNLLDNGSFEKTNVVFLFGVNGVGKSTIARIVQKEVKNSLLLQGSDILMKAVDGDRCLLENVPAEVKKKIKIDELLTIFNNDEKSDKIFLLDSHLLVPIRIQQEVIYEDMWSDILLPYVKNIFYIHANPEQVLNRRLVDFKKTGRKRDLFLENIKQDQQKNVEKFREYFGKHEKAFEVENIDNNIKEASQKIINHIIG